MAESNNEVDSKPPFLIQELVQLQHVGIAANHVTWTRVTMTSDSHICLRCKKTDQGTKEQVTVLDLASDCCQNLSLPRQCESCMVSPSHPSKAPLLAFKAGGSIHLLSLSESGSEVSQCQLDGLHFWTWLDHSHLGLVTEEAVWKWNVRADEKPEEVFFRCERLDYAEIISLKADEKLNWFALTGLLPQECNISGLTEIYSVEKRHSQCIGAHAVTFATYQFTDNQQPSTLLCAASRDDNPDNVACGKVHVVEVDASENLAPRTLIENIHFPEDGAKFDFPMAVHVSCELGLVYIMTKYGRMYVCDIESALCLSTAVISEHVVFTSALNTATQGMLAVSISGKVLSVDMKTDLLLSHIRNVMKKPAIADRLNSLLPKYSTTQHV